MNLKEIKYERPKKPLTGNITLKRESFSSAEEMMDSTITALYSDGSEYEYTQDEMRKELVQEGLIKEKADFVIDYLMNFREIVLDMTTGNLIPVKKRFDLRAA